MKEIDFQEQFEGLVNDYEYAVKKKKSYINIVMGIRVLTLKYIEEYGHDLFRDKCLENGAD